MVDRGTLCHPIKIEKTNCKLDQQSSEQRLFEESDHEPSQQTSSTRTHIKNRSSVGRFPISLSSSSSGSPPRQSPRTKMSTVLNLSEAPRAEGGGSLRRIIKDAQNVDQIVDFWNDVVRFDSSKLEAVMKMAVVDSNYDLTNFIRAIEYQGFDRELYIKAALQKMSVSLFCRFAVLGAVRGSNFARIIDSCEQMPQDMITAFTSVGFVKTPKKRDHITILRCTASIPHWCSFYLLKAGVEKKVKVDCPAALQFPGAASLPMSREIRIQHINFCVAFSALLPGGRFKISIYLTAMQNTIPITDIPSEVTGLLRVNSASESYKLTEEDLKTYGSQVAVTR